MWLDVSALTKRVSESTAAKAGAAAITAATAAALLSHCCKHCGSGSSRSPQRSATPGHRPCTPLARRWAREREGAEAAERQGSSAAEVLAGVSVYATGRAFCLRTRDGEAEAWGHPTGGGDTRGVLADRVVRRISATEDSFVALLAPQQPRQNVTGFDVAVWGELQAPLLPCPACEVVASDKSFAINLVDGRSLAVFKEAAAAEILSRHVVALACTELADAVLLINGQIHIPQGDAADYGGDLQLSSLEWCGGGQVNGNVVSITANAAAFACIGPDGAVASWGDEQHGGWVQRAADARMVTALTSRVADITPSQCAFAARSQDGTVIPWGDAGSGGEVSAALATMLRKVKCVKATLKAFCAVREDGRVVCWGAARYGGDDSEAQRVIAGRCVLSISATRCAFAAVLEDGCCVAWGDKEMGGSTGRPITGVRLVVAARNAFAALCISGEVEVWGDAQGGGVLSDVNRDSIASDGGAVSVTASHFAFAAVTQQGRVVCWGVERSGGLKPPRLRA